MNDIEPEVIKEYKNFLLLNKPSGWIVNDAETVKKQPVLQKYLSENYEYEISKSKRLRSGIVHRLDKETSGVLIIAKNEEIFYGLQKLFKERKVSKKYIALLHGDLKEEKGKISVAVGRLPWNRKRFGVLPGGKSAESRFEVVSKHKKNGDIFTLVNFFPKTGRTHQIRIHAKYLGHPVVSDEFYAGRKTSRKDRIWCKRLFLHAKEISFKDPVSGETIRIEAKLPDDLKLALSALVKVKKNK